MGSLFEIPEDFAALTGEDLQAFIDESTETVRNVTADPASFCNADRSSVELREELSDGVTAIRAAKEELASRDVETADVETAEVDEADEVVDEVELSEEEIADFAAVAEEFADESEDEDELEGEPEEAPVAAAAKPKAKTKPATTASAGPKTGLPAPSRDRKPPSTSEQRVSLVAAGGFESGPDGNAAYAAGDAFPSMAEVAKVMQSRRRQFGLIPDGTQGEKVPIVRASWSDLYPDERRLDGDALNNMAVIASAVDQDYIRGQMSLRRKLGAEGALTASGGLCAPVTPYYQLQMISQASRPVRAALPAFNADRGGIRFARPASLADVTTAVGIRTAAEDGAGGTIAQKTCQVVPCPDFEESDVDIIFHCLQFGNLGARTFPERVTQWNNLTLAAHARLAESNLLTGIDTASTQVTATSLGLGASATLPSQVLAAADGMRSRHRMNPDDVLRVLLPFWVLDLLVSDVYRSQFQRFDMTGAEFVALLRSANVEPSFYIDSAAGRNQVFTSQGAGALKAFPTNVVWYIYPEGSFLYVDGGVLELGLVRDSVLNKTNDFQIFGETFENVAFIGVESLAVASTVCDSGTVTLPHATTCPVNYGS